MCKALIGPRSLSLLAFLSLSLVLAAFNGRAWADHCTGDKDHLYDGVCGYYVEPRPSPTPSPIPTPTLPVSIENKPTVKQDSGDTWTVHVDNFPAPGPSPDPSSGWGSADRELLQSIETQAVHAREALVWGLGIALFGIGVLVVFALPKVR